jgi:hypothetical protein
VSTPDQSCGDGHTSGETRWLWYLWSKQKIDHKLGSTGLGQQYWGRLARPGGVEERAYCDKIIVVCPYISLLISMYLYLKCILFIYCVFLNHIIYLGCVCGGSGVGWGRGEDSGGPRANLRLIRVEDWYLIIESRHNFVIYLIYYFSNINSYLI